MAIAGDDEQVAVADRAEIEAIRAEPDVRRKLTAYARQAVERQVRSADVQLVVRNAQHADARLAEALAGPFSPNGCRGWRCSPSTSWGPAGLREGLDLEAVRDLLWWAIAVEHYDLLVRERGWSSRTLLRVAGHDPRRGAHLRV